MLTAETVYRMYMEATPEHFKDFYKENTATLSEKEVERLKQGMPAWLQDVLPVR